MDQWFKWLRGLFWQPAADERYDRIEHEVQEIKRGMDTLKERTAALEAIHQLVKDAGQ